MKSSLAILLFLTFNACQFQPTEPTNKNKFVTEYVSEDGTYYRMETEKEYYTLNERIGAHLLIVNLSQDTMVYETPHGPVFPLQVKTPNMEDVYYPGWATQTYYKIVLLPGDSLQYDRSWDQYQFFNNRIDYMKAFSGKYVLSFGFRNVNKNKVFGKQIEVTEQGDPLYTYLDYHWYDRDSLNFDFWLRNRISRDLIYSIDSTVVEIIQDEQTLASLAIDSGNDMLQLAANSDYKLYTIRLTKDDPPFAGVEGFFKILLTIHTPNKRISASSSAIINRD